MNFTAIDVETANADVSSICQIGLATYENGCLAAEWKSYVDPEDYFDGINISIHGITEETVRGAPKLPDALRIISGMIGNHVAVCHTHFDRVAIRQGFAKYGLNCPPWTWLDSARIARRTWQQFAYSGYGLKNICDTIGYQYAAHDALEDAKAAAQVLIAAMNQTGIGLDGWIVRVGQPISGVSSNHVARPGNPDGPLSGEVIVFTGALQILRADAASMAAGIGCTVEDRVTKTTTILIVGDQDVKKLAGQIKSSKHRKAEELISKGQQIRILRESDFRELVKSTV